MSNKVGKTVALPNRPEGWWFSWRGRIAAAVLIPAGGLALFSRPMIAGGVWFDIAADALAWISFLAGATLRFWATLYIGGRKAEALVTEGPYSLCRHPLYWGSCLMALSVGLFLHSLTMMSAIGLMVFAYTAATVPGEERYLRARFGAQYSEYAQRVARYRPRLANFHAGETIEVRIKGLRIECGRAARWMWLPVIGAIIAHLRNQPWWPQLLSLP
ncbi:MAG: isoprenylcysteine carboxylmethyltransferase family protein [Deltaproteobacteria bacterium]|nr:isoprenylcysteine carboxylmethyltransferase family protein [Deltaproteobacteria bacterium]